MVEDEVVEGVTFPVQMGLATEASGLKIGEALQGSEGRQALVDGHCRARH